LITRCAFDEAREAAAQGARTQSRLKDDHSAFPPFGLHWLLGLLHVHNADLQEALASFRLEIDEGRPTIYYRELHVQSWIGIGYAPQGCADPRQLTTHFRYDAIEPPRSVECRFDLSRIEAALEALEKSSSVLAGEVRATRETAEAAKSAAEEARDKAQEALIEEGCDPPAHVCNPPIYVSNRLPMIGTITLRPEPFDPSTSSGSPRASSRGDSRTLAQGEPQQ
jgi:hypothetical protein